MNSPPSSIRSLPDMESVPVTLRATYRLVELQWTPVPRSQSKAVHLEGGNPGCLCRMRSWGLGSGAWGRMLWVVAEHVSWEEEWLRDEVRGEAVVARHFWKWHVQVWCPCFVIAILEDAEC